jgi:NAD(P)-dependent dehydrogenase (short-subunit alcohol dehydrogenase family)
VRLVTVLRAGLLEGRGVALAGVPAPAIGTALAGLGARVHELQPGLDEDTKQWASRAGPLHALVCDAASAFGDGGPAGLRESLERAWVATRGVATGALIPAGGGKIVLIAPSPVGGSFAVAARAALENLARTLSVEWARYGVTTVAVAPGSGTGADELAELVCFLVSPAGDYFSGCLLEMGSGELGRTGTMRP